jgi:eukaryotic-like serine/threonine-protein kinase
LAKADADRNLLFGIPALHMDFVTRAALIAGMNAWVLQKDKPLGQVLVDQGALVAEHRTWLEAMVSAHLKAHGDDPARSLAAVASTDAVQRELNRVPDPDVHASLDRLGAARIGAEGDPDRTATYPGLPTSAGGRFRVLRFQDRGELGEVFVARDEELHREVALEQIRADQADDAQRRARFLVEAEITRGLEHPGIVPVYGRGTTRTADRPTPCASSAATASRPPSPASTGPRPAGATTTGGRWGCASCWDASWTLAARSPMPTAGGLLHRDPKPGNIMLGPFGETLVVDWGLAKSATRPEAGVPDGGRTPVPHSGSGVQATEAGSRASTPAGGAGPGQRRLQPGRHPALPPDRPRPARGEGAVGWSPRPATARGPSWRWPDDARSRRGGWP